MGFARAGSNPADCDEFSANGEYIVLYIVSILSIENTNNWVCRYGRHQQHLEEDGDYGRHQQHLEEDGDYGRHQQHLEEDGDYRRHQQHLEEGGDYRRHQQHLE